jgi:lysine 2,3-aminomutase
MDSVTHDMDNKEITEPPGNEGAPGEEPPSKGHWEDWRWQLKNRITTIDEIQKLVGGIAFISEKASQKFPISITPYYFSLIQRYDNSDPVFRMCMPQEEELLESMYKDPLCEEQTMPVPGLVHRYKDRALIISTTFCSMYCRYCTRKRTVGVNNHVLNNEELKSIAYYLEKHPEISDVIISGGDPFTFDTSKLEHILSTVRSIPSVQVIRIGTKVPVVLPQRIDMELAKMLSKYHPLFVNTHFNHPIEITESSKTACERLINAGIPVGNQSVLLRGVNDNKLVYEELCRKLIAMRVRPYYLYQCDLVNGIEHFRTRVSRGIEIMEHLRGRLSGMAIPQYVIDSPGGKGKIPILPTYLISQAPEKVILRNFEGQIVEYPESQIA